MAYAPCRRELARHGSTVLAPSLALVFFAAWQNVASGQGPSQPASQPIDSTDVIAEIRLQPALRELHPQFFWFHPRVAAVPGLGKDENPLVVMTLQKHLRVSDFYSGLYYMLSRDLGQSWEGPREIPQLGWQKQPDGSIFAVADVTPGYHPQTGKVIAIGTYVYYDAQGHQLANRPKFSQSAYAVYDPKRDEWTGWKILPLPEAEKFNLARNACSQWLVEEDGTLLVPLYFSPNAFVPCGVTVARCRFDGNELVYLEHGDELHLAEGRGLVEPSLIKCAGEYFLTIRNDLRGYVTRSKDGLRWEAIRPWLFDDGTELGSYNTQQHWLVWEDHLYLSYTRRGAGNDHIMRHRAPLFVAKVDHTSLRVIRATERVAVPERGVPLGNFGAAPITEKESWLTDAETMAFGLGPHPRGADGTVWIARIIWRSQPK
ncbi:MAG: exo-alpha-sialidase [Thermoguttaceae bacterium]|nr:exo-alpha-sialidase [Thermoguttaceae bacterium]MDW8079351.1 exo-alpha-sialidase [Thermoguttaceae bacterium]